MIHLNTNKNEKANIYSEQWNKYCFDWLTPRWYDIDALFSFTVNEEHSEETQVIQGEFQRLTIYFLLQWK